MKTFSFIVLITLLVSTLNAKEQFCISEEGQQSYSFKIVRKDVVIRCDDGKNYNFAPPSCYIQRCHNKYTKALREKLSAMDINFLTQITTGDGDIAIYTRGLADASRATEISLAFRYVADSNYDFKKIANYEGIWIYDQEILLTYETRPTDIYERSKKVAEYNDFSMVYKILKQQDYTLLSKFTDEVSGKGFFILEKN